MPLRITSSPATFSLAAGEAMVFGFQDFIDRTTPESLANRAFVFSIYNGDRTPVMINGEPIYEDATITQCGGTECAIWTISGETSNALFGRTNLLADITERLNDSSEQLFHATVNISIAAPNIADYDEATFARHISIIRRTNDPTDAAKPTYSITSRFYRPGATLNPPVNTVAPTVSGTAREGEVLTANTGTWSNSPTLSIQWLRNTVAVAGQTGPFYTLTSDDVGAIIAVRVTASNADGSVIADSAPTQTVAAAAPVFTTQPSISPSSGESGQTYTANDGQASRASSFTRRWLLNGQMIGTGTTVIPNAGGTLSLEVTAIGAGGSVVANAPEITITEAFPAPPTGFQYVTVNGDYVTTNNGADYVIVAVG